MASGGSISPTPSPSAPGPNDSILVDTAGGILTAVIIVAVIVIVILGFFSCALVVHVRKRYTLARERDVEAVTALGEEGRSGLTILRGASFKVPPRNSEREEARHQIVTITALPRDSSILDLSPGSEVLNTASSDLEIDPYAVAHGDGLNTTVSEEDRGDSGLAKSFNDLRYPQAASLDSNLDTLEDRDYSEIEDIEAEPSQSPTKIPLPYMRPVSVQPSARVDLPREEGYFEEDNPYSVPGVKGKTEWADDSNYAQLYATLEQHFYSVPSSPDEVNDSNVSESSSDSGGYASTVLAPINTMDVPQVDCSHFDFLRELGDGHFGRVYLAESVGLSLKDLRIDDRDTDTNVSVLVAVKSLKENSPLVTQCAFVKEVRLMSKLSHSHIVNLLGVCIRGQPFMVMEFMIHGDLKHHLQKCSFSDDTQNENSVASSNAKRWITLPTLVSMCLQIADGMQYLASLNLVHRDLAARNCLLGASNIVKVADFGMTRTPHYPGNSNTALPVRHIPYECLHGRFSEKSDVWSFGVTMWEIFTLGKMTPYKEMTNRALMYDALKGAARRVLPRPSCCPDQLYTSVMKKCWRHRPQDRPTFKQLHQIISKL
jgi:hypothetical protein